MQKIICTLVLLLLCSLAIAKTLTIATDASYPPFEDTDFTSGNIVGFDIDIAQALCSRIQANCTFVNVPFIDLLKGLNAGKYDAVVRALSITPARKRLVDFTNPYFQDNGSFVAAVSAKLNTSKTKLANKTIGVQEGTTFENYLKTYYANIALIRTYEYFEEAMKDLAANNVDVVLGDSQVINLWLHNQQGKNYEVIGKTIDDKKIFGDGIGIAVKKGNVNLVNQFNKALAEIKQDGSYQKIMDQYFITS